MNYLVFTNCLVACFVLGIFAVDYVKIPLPVLYGIFLGFLVITGVLYYKNKRITVVVILFVFFLAGMIRCMQADFIAPNDVSQLIGKSGYIQGEVVEIPQVRELAEDKVSVRYIISVANAQVEGKSISASGKLKVSAMQDKDHPIAGDNDKIALYGEVKALHGYQNPGSLDTVAMLNRQGIRADCRAGKNTVEIIEQGKNFFLQWIEKSRQSVQKLMEKAMPPADASALFAMLFGGYEGIKPELLAAFTATGIVHILSVSGSHVSLLAGTVHIVGKALRFPPWCIAGMVIVAIAMYAVFSGFTSPVVRSALMGMLAFIALAFNREKDARYSLALTALAILAVTPRLIFDISFELSFMATVGLLYIAPEIKQGLVKLPRFIAENLAITIAAQVSVIPFIAWYFNNVSVSSLLANLVAVPLIEWTIIGGLAAVLIGVIFPFGGQILFVACSLMIGFVYFITQHIAAIPFGVLYLPSGGLFCGIVYYLLLFWLCGYHAEKIPSLRSCWQTKRNVMQIAGICILLLWGSQFFVTQPLRVHFIDVGQGDSILLTTPHGKAVLFDTGGVRREFSDFDIGKRVVEPYLRHYGVRELACLCLTHAHEDHAGGAGSLLKDFPVEHVIVGRENRSEYAKTLGYSLEKCNAFITAYDGQQILVDGVKIEVFLPDEVATMKTGNELSNVFRISYGDFSVLITGDLDSEGEQELIKKHKLNSSILKVGHHGSRTSSSEAFLQAVQPLYAIISVGFHNSFGHPNPQVLGRLNQCGIKTLRTDQDGAILIESDGKKMSVHPFER